MEIREAYQMVYDDLLKRQNELEIQIRALKHWRDCPLAEESLFGTQIHIEIDPTLHPGEWYLRKARKTNSL